MTTLANANALFTRLAVQPSFTKVIHIQAGDDEDKLLRSARAKIRAALRSTFKTFKIQLADSTVSEALFEKRTSAYRDASKQIDIIDIRFLTQGSFVYGTLVRPAKLSHQEIDLDDGIYIPIPFIKGKPIFSSSGLFLVISTALEPLLKLEGWKLEKKDTCLRIKLSGTHAHIDLPLFAVEDDAFRRLEKKFQLQTGKELRSTNDLNEVLDTTSAKSIRLTKPEILLAHRKEDWVASDPKAIHDWFISQVERYGPVLRRLCRYSKAWRDNTWAECSMSSLALMAVCVEALNKLDSQVTDSRDDLLMLKVAELMPKIIRKGGIVWKQGETPLDAKWSDAERLEFENKAKALHLEMNTALNSVYIKAAVVAHLQNCFGPRFPNAPESVKIGAEFQTAAIKSSAAATVPLPKIKNSISA